MTHMEAMAAVAQGVINIAEADSPEVRAEIERLTDKAQGCAIEKDSRIYRGMVKICDEEITMISRLQEIKRRLQKGRVDHALAIVTTLIRERTDLSFEG